MENKIEAVVTGSSSDGKVIVKAGMAYLSLDSDNYENLAQLNARSENDRKRSNHTGTQKAETISDFKEAVEDLIPAPIPVPDATTTSKGVIRLSGDLGGTADNPTVPALANIYTKAEVNAKLSAVYISKGSVNTYSDLLALTGQEIGWVWNVKTEGKNYAWVGVSVDFPNGWDDIGGTFDVSGKEDKSNKTDNIALNKTSSEKYTSSKGVNDYIVSNDNLFDTNLNGTKLRIKRPNGTFSTGVDITQSSVVGLIASLETKEDKSNKGATNGYAPLNADKELPLVNTNKAVKGSLKLYGEYNGTVISSAIDSALNGTVLPTASTSNTGWMFKVITAFTGFNVGDMIVSNGTSWYKVGGSGGGTSLENAIYMPTMSGAVSIDLSSFKDLYGIAVDNTILSFTNLPAVGKTIERNFTLRTNVGKTIGFPPSWRIFGKFNNTSVENFLRVSITNYPTVGLRGACHILNDNNYVIVMKTTTANESITIPMQGITNNYTVAWGDGTYSNHTATATHQYKLPGEYVINIDGEYSYVTFNATEPTKLLEIRQWGSNKWTSFNGSYQGCSNLRVTATDTPDISLVTSFSSAFRNCSSLNFCMNTWDLSNVTVFQNMFLFATNFNNGGLPVLWNTNSATSFNQAFFRALAFNQSLAGLNVSKATTLTSILDISVSVENYSLSLIGWATQNVTTGAVLNVGTLKYNSSAIAARATLISKGWTITDGGLA